MGDASALVRRGFYLKAAAWKADTQAELDHKPPVNDLGEAKTLPRLAAGVAPGPPSFHFHRVGRFLQSRSPRATPWPLAR
jgi:hypothetical protein